MKIIIVGATGTIGKKVLAAFDSEHEVIGAGSKSGDIRLDITSPGSIESFYKEVGPFDALISTTGSGHFGPLQKMTDKDFMVGITSKLMGQVNLVLIGQHFINPRGSFTLTSGILSEEPVVAGANLSTVNGAINAFVIGAAIELGNGVRINAVSPGVVEDSPSYFPSSRDKYPQPCPKL
jgi:NAD(P)-dependent dehydrogenase (short-subunit alcohol dehydrogenase family)